MGGTTTTLADFVDLALASLCRSRDGVTLVKLDEPIVWLAGVKLLSEPANRAHMTSVLRAASEGMAKANSNDQDPQGTGKRLEKVLALALAYMDEPGKHLLHLVRETNQQLMDAPVTLPDWCVLLVAS